MKLTRLVACILTLLFISASAKNAAGQATGTPPFGSFAGGPEVINLADLNAHWNFPIISKAGRGLGFHYAIGFDNSLWHVLNVNGQNTWQPINATLGWTRQTEGMAGYVTYRSYVGCGGTNYLNWVYFDPGGTNHSFNLLVGPCYSASSGGAAATDSSGYQISVNTTPSATVYPPSGGAIQPPLQNATGQARIIDANGNTISTNDGRTLYDTTSVSTAALTLADNGGGVQFPTSFTYTAPGGSKTTTVAYTGYNVQSNFGCAGIAEYGPIFMPLLTSITYADGSSYQIIYRRYAWICGQQDRKNRQRHSAHRRQRQLQLFGRRRRAARNFLRWHHGQVHPHHLRWYQQLSADLRDYAKWRRRKRN